MSQRVLAFHLGLVPYEPAWQLQQRLQRELIRVKREAGTAENAPPHVLLLVEHPPVFTLGRNGLRGNLLANQDLLAQRNASFVEVDRGGDITYHGPGQLVAYPILDLDRLRYPDGGRGTDIHRYLRELEEAVILTCGDYGLSAKRIAGRTGVWIGPDDRGPERKVCAMGIRCSRWVTMHGLAFNIDPDLSYFDLIVPCGIRDRGVTSLAQELETAPDSRDVISHFLRHFEARFEVTLSEHTGPESLAILSIPDLVEIGAHTLDNSTSPPLASSP